MIYMNLDRTHHVEDINAGMKGQEVVLGGWVEDLRKIEILNVKLRLMELMC